MPIEEKNIKKKRGFSSLLEDDDTDNDINSNNLAVEKSSNDFYARNDGVDTLPDLVSVSAPDNIDNFQKNISKIPGYKVVSLNENDNKSFVVYKIDADGQETEVLKGNQDTCQMRTPLDPEILKAYINAPHKGNVIIVDRCKSKEAVDQLLKACNSNLPPVVIKFRAGIFEELRITDPWITRHALPAEPDVSIKMQERPGRGMKG